ncbi:hypothetical protein EVAR_9753_1 [Eumeta japonica]|uniref:Uncharacterized protein n=1 Tax=Eumeta variegata TaxID=151549 RepID=A0A4C1U5M7_EUMVA|nr:hypothetical protein EVAR_9753_1 [Eumeta japonica]
MHPLTNTIQHQAVSKAPHISRKTACMNELSFTALIISLRTVSVDLQWAGAMDVLRAGGAAKGGVTSLKLSSHGRQQKAVQRDRRQRRAHRGLSSSFIEGPDDNLFRLWLESTYTPD